VSRSDLPTAKVTPAPVVLVVGCPAELVVRCREAAIAGQSLVVEADVATAATLAAQTRPLVMVVLEDVYAFDATSFNDLAADVRARLVLLPDDRVPQPELEQIIVSAILEAEASRESFNNGWKT
jgi:hypothetical protein